MKETFRERFRAAVDKEKVDPMPHELLSPEFAPLTMREQIQQSIRSEISLRAQDSGLESFEEADDFEEDDPDADLLSPYQMVLMTPEPGNDDGLDGVPPEEPQEEGDPTPTPTTSEGASEAPEAPQEPVAGANPA